MDKIKNYAIAILTGLLVLSLFTQPAQSAGKSLQAKQIEYQFCLDASLQIKTTGFSFLKTIDEWINACSSYRP